LNNDTRRLPTIAEESGPYDARLGDSRSYRKRRKRSRRDRVSSVGVVRFDSRPANRADFRAERRARRRRGRATTRVQSATDRAPVGGQYCRLGENLAPIGLYFLRAAVFCDLSAHRDVRSAVLRRPQLSNDAGSMYKRRENETETVAVEIVAEFPPFSVRPLYSARVDLTNRYNYMIDYVVCALHYSPGDYHGHAE